MSRRATSIRRYLETNSTQGNFTTKTPALASGWRYDLTPVGGDLFINYATASPWWKVIPLNDFRGMRLGFITTGTANNTSNYRIWCVEDCKPAGGNPFAAIPLAASDITQVKLTSFGIGTFVSSAQEGANNSALTTILKDDEFDADAITFALSTNATTPRGPATVRNTAYELGSVAAYSSANDTGAELVIPDFGSGVWGVVVEMDLVTITGANMWYQLTK